jgi:hypothetical protein
MLHAIANKSFSRTAAALLAAALAALALAGCQSPMYSGTPDDMGYAVAPTYEDRSYVGRNEQAGDAKPAEQQAWTADRSYEYRGGRDPVSGKAGTQM